MSKDQTWRRDEPQSPCVRICVVHPEERLCVGCYRTVDEIAGWASLSVDARRRIMADLPARAPRLARRRGGRKARLQGD